MAQNHLVPANVAAAPNAARILLTLCLDDAHRDAVLGDVEEGFQSLYETSPRRARAWYWRQAFLSAAPLLGDKIRTNVRHIVLFLIISIGIIGTVLAWDRHVVQVIAWKSMPFFGQSPFVTPRGIYVLVYGASFAGLSALLPTMIDAMRIFATVLNRRAIVGLFICSLAPCMLALILSIGSANMGLRIFQVTAAASGLFVGHLLSRRYMEQ